MTHIEQIDLKGKTYHLFNRQDLIDLIYEQMGSQVASLVEAEFKEAQEEFDEQLGDLQEQLQALKETAKGKCE